MTDFTFHSPLDMHVHLREGAALPTLAALTAQSFASAVVMPNLQEPVDSLEALLAYREAIVSATQAWDFEPCMTLFFKNFSRCQLEAARPHLLGVKLYPKDITTRSEQGVECLDDILETLGLLEDLGITLMVHGESTGFPPDRETAFLPTYHFLAKTFPKLHIVMEHITTAHALDCLEAHENLSATLTVHHLLLSLDDLLGESLKPHLFCKPIVKSKRDRHALRQAALAAHPKICLGTDSAPHPQSAKLSATVPPGIFSSPVALPLLTELFERHDALESLSAFVCENATSLYKIRPPIRAVQLCRQAWNVPCSYGDMVPLKANTSLAWRLASSL